MRWVVGLAQGVTGRMRSFLSFTTVTVVFTMLGLLEVPTGQRKLARVGRQGGGVTLLRAAAEIARKMQTYMLVRTIMSAVTGLSVWAFASAIGLDLPMEWGVIAFSMNYIPFIGPLIATMFPTVFAILQFGHGRCRLRCSSA